LEAGVLPEEREIDVIISNEQHTPLDKEETSDLIKVLADVFDQFESSEEGRMREEVIGKLNEIVKEWIY
jgi:poly(A) polymerase Pap1